MFFSNMQKFNMDSHSFKILLGTFVKGGGTLGISIFQIAGRVIKHYREALGLSQKELAKKCSILQSTLSRIEIGETSVDIGQLRTLAKGLETSVKKMLEEIETSAAELEKFQEISIKNDKKADASSLAVPSQALGVSHPDEFKKSDLPESVIAILTLSR